MIKVTGTSNVVIHREPGVSYVVSEWRWPGLFRALFVLETNGRPVKYLTPFHPSLRPRFQPSCKSLWEIPSKILSYDEIAIPAPPSFPLFYYDSVRGRYSVSRPLLYLLFDFGPRSDDRLVFAKEYSIRTFRWYSQPDTLDGEEFWLSWRSLETAFSRIWRSSDAREKRLFKGRSWRKASFRIRWRGSRRRGWRGWCK